MNESDDEKKDDLFSLFHDEPFTPERFGELLKKERESRFFTCSDISKKTGVRKVFIEALEKGNFDELPNMVFVRGFVNSIVKLMELDKKQILNSFEEAVNCFLGAEKSLEIDENEKMPLLYKFVGIGIIVTIITFFFIMYRVYLTGGERVGTMIQIENFFRP